MSTDADGAKKRGMFARLFGKGGEEPKTRDARRRPPKRQRRRTRSWWQRLSGGLSRTSQAISQGVADIFTKRKLDALTLEELEDVLLRADLGVGAATRITKAVGKARYEKDIAPDEVRAILASEVEAVLDARRAALRDRRDARSPSSFSSSASTAPARRRPSPNSPPNGRARARRSCSPLATHSAPRPWISSRSGARGSAPRLFRQ